MTALVIATDIPTNIDTVEKLKAWADCLLEELYKGQTYKEASGSSIDSGLAPYIDQSIINTADGSVRLISRGSIQLNTEYRTDKTKKFWEFAQPVGSATIPAAFKTN